MLFLTRGIVATRYLPDVGLTLPDTTAGAWTASHARVSIKIVCQKRCRCGGPRPLFPFTITESRIVQIRPSHDRDGAPVRGATLASGLYVRQEMSVRFPCSSKAASFPITSIVVSPKCW
jgi:hypothetical protein